MDQCGLNGLHESFDTLSDVSQKSNMNGEHDQRKDQLNAAVSELLMHFEASEFTYNVCYLGFKWFIQTL